MDSTEKQNLLNDISDDDQNITETKINLSISEGTLKRELKFRFAFGYVIANIMGAGIFITPSLVARNTPNFFIALLAWIIAGIMAISGSLCCCEMVSLVNKTGSIYIFVYETYGEVLGFFVHWINTVIIIPCHLAIYLHTIGLYVCAPFFTDLSSSKYAFYTKLSGILVCSFVTILNLISIKKSAIIQTIMMVVQVTTLSVFLFLAVYYVYNTGDVHNISPSVVFNNTWSGLTNDIPSFGLAVFDALYCFDGYFMIAALVEEIINPKRSIPLLSFTTMPTLIIIYIVINLSCVTVVGFEDMRRSDIIFEEFVSKVGGVYVAAFVPLVIAFFCVPAYSGTIYQSVRRIMSASREGQFPEAFSLIHKKSRVPIVATIFVSILALILLLFNFNTQQLLIYYNVALWLEYALAFSTVVVNKERKPNATRTYTTWITTPIFMCLVATFLIALAVVRNPLEIGIQLLIMFLGLPVYYITIYKKWFSFIPNKQISIWLANRFNLIKCVVENDQ